jgi:hypothetical protein
MEHNGHIVIGLFQGTLRRLQNDRCENTSVNKNNNNCQWVNKILVAHNTAINITERINPASTGGFIVVSIVVFRISRAFESHTRGDTSSWYREPCPKCWSIFHFSNDLLAESKYRFAVRHVICACCNQPSSLGIVEIMLEVVLESKEEPLRVYGQMLFAQETVMDLSKH